MPPEGLKGIERRPSGASAAAGDSWQVDQNLWQQKKGQSFMGTRVRRERWCPRPEYAAERAYNVARVVEYGQRVRVWVQSTITTRLTDPERRNLSDPHTG